MFSFEISDSTQFTLNSRSDVPNHSNEAMHNEVDEKG